jgi:hypothetical protein
LEKLNRELADLDYSIDGTDPLYPLFVKAMTQWQKTNLPFLPVLTATEQEAQQKAASDIVRQIKAQQA